MQPGGLSMQIEGVPADPFGAVIDRLASEIEGALRRHPILHDQVSHVPGGAYWVPDEMDGARVGFKMDG
jgi:hypothetical protein